MRYCKDLDPLLPEINRLISSNRRDLGWYAKLYADTKNILIGIASRILHNDEDAADVVHKVYEEIADRIVAEGEQRPLRLSDLTTLTIYRSFDRIKERKSGLSFDTDLESKDAQTLSNPFTSEDTERIFLAVESCLETLHEADREFILSLLKYGSENQQWVGRHLGLIDEEGKEFRTPKELAEQLGLSMSNYYQLRSRIKHKLRYCMQEKLGEIFSRLASIMKRKQNNAQKI